MTSKDLKGIKMKDDLKEPQKIEPIKAVYTV